MASVKKRSPGPFYLVAAVWLAFALFSSLYRPIDYILAAVASVIVFLYGRHVWPDRTYTLPGNGGEKSARAEKQQEPKRPEPAPSPTGNPEIDALIAQRDLALGEMKRLNDSIADPGISAQIDELESLTEKIIAAVIKEPKKLPQIRRFMNYYLPTTLKLLNAYDRMDQAGISGTNIDGTKGRIEDMMTKVVEAFRQQLDSLFQDEAVDISSDITVMEQMLAREGIGGLQFESTPASNPESNPETGK